MNKDIRQLDPMALWENFYRLTRIPRPSHHEEAVQEYVFQFGKKLGLETQKDGVGNIVIRKPASSGMETRKGVILQSHLDMVPQKNKDKIHDFLKDPVEAVVAGEWVTASGTTLGADNGIGAAAALSVLESQTISHGPLEALFTATEETGLTGAQGLKLGMIQGDILLNMDSEEEGEFCIGCAGGIDLSAFFSYARQEVPSGSTACQISLTGLKGGHSGTEIHLQRGNANQLFFRLLQAVSKVTRIRIASVEGGDMRNAIPRETFGVVTVDASAVSRMEEAVRAEFTDVKKELSATAPDIELTLTKVALPDSVMDIATQEKLIMSVLACPDGVDRMSDTVPGLVETSGNMAIVRFHMDQQTVEVSFLLRSSVDSAKMILARRIEALFSMAGARVVFSDSYPGWKPNMNSQILALMVRVYQERFGRKPEVKAIHAGLECGILGGIYPGWDMISFGPTIKSPHSPDERVNIASVAKFWDFLLDVLKNIPAK